MRVAVISGNLGSYDQEYPWVEQELPEGVEYEVFRFNDSNFSPRPKALKPALQVGILKMLAAWLFIPGRDLYFWIDASCALTNQNALRWFLEQLGDAELLVFKHPERSSIKSEYRFMKTRMARPGETYLTSRYEGEWIDQLYESIAEDESYVDDRLFASTAFMYRPTDRVRLMMEQWWITKSVYCLHDQISWPYLIWRAGCAVNVINQNYMNCEYLEFVRKRTR